MKRITSVFYDDLNIDVLKEASPDVLKVVKDNIDFYFMIKLKENNNNAVIFSNGAYDPQKSDPPIFMRSRFADSYNANCIFIDDVTIHNTSLRIGWGIGRPDKHYLVEYSEIVKTILNLLNVDDENTVYFGSSAGGFMSMGLSILHKGSKAVVNNPQFYATTYARGLSLKRLFIEIFPDMERKEILEQYSDRFSITNMMRKHKHVPEILVIQNRMHEPDIKEQYEPFIKTCEKYRLKMDNVEFLFYHANNGHDPIPNEKAADLVNANFKVKKKGILFVLNSKSERNGLQDNVYQTAVEARDRGYKVYIAHRPGEFLTKVYREGFNVVNVDFKNIRETVDKIKRTVNDDLNIIHMHPGDSRKVGLFLKRELNVPLVMTLHGKWTDSVGQYSESLDAIFGVSEGVKHKLLDECEGAEEKVHVIPNYSKFKSDQTSSIAKSRTMNVSVITRLDKDKELIIDKIKELVPVLNQHDKKLTLNIVGDGELRTNLENYFKDNLNNENINIIFKGWVHDDASLLNEYNESDIIIGPGRVVIDGYTLNKPALVIGSKAYEGVMDKSNWQKFVASNFGGYRHNIDFSDKDIVADFAPMINDEELRKENAKLGHKIVSQFFNEEITNNKLFNIYNIIEK